MGAKRVNIRKDAEYQKRCRKKMRVLASVKNKSKIMEHGRRPSEQPETQEKPLHCPTTGQVATSASESVREC